MPQSRKRKKPTRRAAPARQQPAGVASVRQALAAAGVGAGAPAPQPVPAVASDRTAAHGVAAGGLDGFVARNAPEVVGVTCAFDPPSQPPVQTVRLRLIGQRRDEDGTTARSRTDRFDYEETLPGVLGGSGPVAVTVKVRDVPAGQWDVRAEARTAGADLRLSRPLPVQQVAWSWRRWRLVPTAGTVRTRLAPFVPAPAVLLGSWLALVVLGVVLALVVQSLVLATQPVRLGHVLTISLLSVAAGAVGAKAWYVVLHRRERRWNGWAIQGLVAGFAVAAPLLLWLFGVPTGVYLDGSAPALLVGMATGRVGCFLTGCCAGRPTRSRWGVLCSNRVVAARRIPVQLLESAVALTVAAGALVEVLTVGPRHGMIFVAALAGYTLVRQRLLLLREEKRQSDRGPRRIAATAGVVLLGAVVLAVVSP